MKDVAFMLPETCALIPEKRYHYRTSVSMDLLSITAIDILGRKTPGHVFDLSAGGLGLFFVVQADPGYDLGTVLWLRMRSPFLLNPVVAPAQICRVSECDIGRMYGLRFLDWPELLSRIPPELARVFNRRGEHRTRIDTRRPVEIFVQGLPSMSWEQVFQGMKGVLLDVSPTGLSFRVGTEAAEQIEPHRSVEVSFTLPSSTYEFTFWIQVLHCSRRPDGICCGALFDEERTEDFDEKQERLLMLLD